MLLVETGANVNLERASRNLEGVTLVPTTALEPYDLLRHDRLMLSREAAVRVEPRAFGDEAGAKPRRTDGCCACAGKEAGSEAPRRLRRAKAAKKAAAPKAAKKPRGGEEAESKRSQAEGEKGISR